MPPTGVSLHPKRRDAPWNRRYIHGQQQKLALTMLFDLPVNTVAGSPEYAAVIIPRSGKIAFFSLEIAAHPLTNRFLPCYRQLYPLS